MLDICKLYFDEHKITISTNIVVAKSKTKCIAFGSKLEPIPIILEDKSLPWVLSWPHLGHILHQDESMRHDLMKKRGEFIGKLHSLRQEFGNKDPIVFMNLVSIYLSSFYGSNLWDLYGDYVDRLFKTWNVMVRMFFNLPRETHRNLIVPISSTSHLKTKLVKRFIKFYNSIEKCDKPHLKYLLEKQKNDVRSVFGRNVMNICSEAGTDRISLVNLDNIDYVPLPIEEHWRIPLLKDLLEARTGRTFVDLTRREINSIICLVTTS